MKQLVHDRQDDNVIVHRMRHDVLMHKTSQSLTGALQVPHCYTEQADAATKSTTHIVIHTLNGRSLHHTGCGARSGSLRQHTLPPQEVTPELAKAELSELNYSCIGCFDCLAGNTVAAVNLPCSLARPVVATRQRLVS
jgi:hypothetical protein